MENLYWDWNLYFGFDWNFMIQRAEELGCLQDFLKLSKNLNEGCKIKYTVTKVASGTHEQKYVKINGRVQLDLYNYFRRDYQLMMYKLDYVSGYFIGDGVKKIEHIDDENITKIGPMKKGLRNNFFSVFWIEHMIFLTYFRGN